MTTYDEGGQKLGWQHTKSAARIAIEEHLLAMEVGDLVTYSDLAELAGLELEKAAAVAGTAQRAISRRQGTPRFSSVSGLGIRRLDNSGTGKLVGTRMQQARRKARIATQIGRAVDPLALPAEEGQQFMATMAVARLIEETTKPSTITAIGARRDIMQIDSADAAKRAMSALVKAK